MDRIKFRFVDINTALSVSTSVLTVLLTFSAFALSYSVLYELALAHGFQPWLAWLWPLSLDAFVIIATIAVVRNSLRDESTQYPIFLVGAFTLLSIILNTIDVNNLTWLAEVDPWVTRTIRGSIYVSVHALPPIVVFLSIELAATIGKSEVKRYAEIKSQQQLQLETAAMRQQAEAERATIQAELERLAEQRQQLETSGSFGMMIAIFVPGRADGESVGEYKLLNHLRHDAAAGFVGGEPPGCHPIQTGWGSGSTPGPLLPTRR